MRYTLNHLYTKTQFGQAITSGVDADMMMGILPLDLDFVAMKNFIISVVYGYFYNDLVAYEGDNETDVKAVFIQRLCYDINVKAPYWYRKYLYVQKLLTSEDFNLLQTSKMTSSSNDKTQSAGGTLQKTATTPTGVTATTTPDEINIDVGEGTDEGDNSIETNGFADKYTNAQQKFANAMLSKGERSGEIMREGSVDDLINVLEKLPSSFANEIDIVLQKHFIFDYDGEMKGYYTEN
ncbi:MAG: hypothetical protein J6S67_09795 [Methanobrevibacter sp.]|nr:hypothetical protein [Methanobrevibacter sp.]